MSDTDTYLRDREATGTQALAFSHLEEFIPAGRSTKLRDLTPEWFQSAMTPRYQPDGTVLYTLTPPRSGGRRDRLKGIGTLLGIVIIIAIGALFWLPLLARAA